MSNDIVEVIWEDTTTYIEWLCADDHTLPITICSAVGHLVCEDNEVVRLAGIAGFQQDKVTGHSMHIIIPKRSIQTIKKLVAQDA